MTGHTYAVANAKGGVGKTTTAVNLAGALAQDRRVAAVDLDLAMANVGDVLDIDEEIDVTLHDVLADEADVGEAAYVVEDDFAIVPSGSDLTDFANTTVENLDEVVDELQWAFDTVLLDTGAGVSQEVIEPLAVADETIIVTRPRRAAISDARKTAELVERVDGSVAGVVVTRPNANPSPGLEPVDVADELATDLLGTIPDDDAVPRSQDAGEHVIAHAPDSEAAAAIEDLAAVVRGDSPPLGERDDDGETDDGETDDDAKAGDDGEASDGDDGESDEEAADSDVAEAVEAKTDGGVPTDDVDGNGDGAAGETEAKERPSLLGSLLSIVAP